MRSAAVRPRTGTGRHPSVPYPTSRGVTRRRGPPTCSKNLEELEFGPKIVRAGFNLDRLTGKRSSRSQLTVHVGPGPVNGGHDTHVTCDSDERSARYRLGRNRYRYCPQNKRGTTLNCTSTCTLFGVSTKQLFFLATGHAALIFTLPRFIALHPYSTLFFFSSNMCVHFKLSHPH